MEIMISMLAGTVIYHGIGFIILEVQSVGYKITIPENIAHGLSGFITLYTHEAVRDDGHELFGFTSIEGLEFCWKLIDVPGVGPKLAQKIITGGRDINEVKEKITKGDVGFLSTIPGVGKKTAQKIILELQGKLVDAPGSRVDQDALSALMGLGYSRLSGEEALSDIADELSTEDKIRSALKLLAR